MENGDRFSTTCESDSADAAANPWSMRIERPSFEGPHEQHCRLSVPGQPGNSTRGSSIGRRRAEATSNLLAFEKVPILIFFRFRFPFLNLFFLSLLCFF